MSNKLPKYVWLDKVGNCALRLRKRDTRIFTSIDREKDEYYRDAGQWGLEFKYKEGVLVSHCPHMEWLHEKTLIECTRKEYNKDNKGYV